jgi:nitrogen fixation NifU-like protein
MSSNADIYHEMIVTFHDSNPLCGDSIDIDMKIDENKVTDIKFHGKGCAICMACSSVLTEITKGKTLEEARALEKNDVLSELGLEHLQAVRIKCALLSLKVLKSALYTYIGKNLKDTEDVDKLKEEAANLY